MNREVYALLYADKKDGYEKITPSFTYAILSPQELGTCLDANGQWVWLQAAQSKIGKATCQSMEVDAIHQPC